MIDNRIILIVDDHNITRRGIYETIFDNIKDIDIIECDCEASAIEKIQKNKFINLIVTDLQLTQTGKSFNIPKLANKLNIPFIIFSAFENKIFIEESLKNNALGYIAKRSGSECLIEGINKAFQGEKYICKISTDSLEKENLYWNPKPLILSPTENFIIESYDHGMSTEMILKKFKFSENTLRTHRRNILNKNMCTFEQVIYSYNEWHRTE